MFIRPFWKVKRVLDCRIFETNVFHSEIVVAKTNNISSTGIILLHALMSVYYTCDFFLE